MSVSSQGKSQNDPCVIASHRPWNRNVADRLQENLDLEFILISDPDVLTFDYLQKIQPQYIFFPHWSYRIPESIFTNFECIIFHMTDLPFGRGGSPLQNLIARGIYETKITALRCIQELDAGDIYLKKPLSLYGSAEEIFIRASETIEEMIAEIIENQYTPIPQEGEPEIFKRRKPQQSNLQGSLSLKEVFDRIRMLDAEGYPHAFIQVGSLRFEFTRASLKTDSVLADVKITIVDEGKE
ncbi:Methionyl-tRNA formyltransferase-like protein 2 [Geitlerinema sp. FC II]|nr:Methionyl-tRNA formyltransferase-like protein 2 [Geitlerinema sp. FC II]